jgi:hypothetical protein
MMAWFVPPIVIPSVIVVGVVIMIVLRLIAEKELNTANEIDLFPTASSNRIWLPGTADRWRQLRRTGSTARGRSKIS